MNRRLFQPVSSVYGKISEILLLFPVSAKEMSDPLLADRYKGILAAFGDRVRFVIMGKMSSAAVQGKEFNKLKDEFKNEVFRVLQKSGLHKEHHVVKLRAELAFGGHEGAEFAHNEWAQDPFVVLLDENEHPVLLEPMLHGNKKVSYVAEQVAHAAGFLLRPTRYHLEGGNVLIGDDYAIVGKNLLERNRKQYYEGVDPEEAAAKITHHLQQDLGVKYLFWAGEDKKTESRLRFTYEPEGFQPFFHLDLYMNLAGMDDEGRETIFLAQIDKEMIFGERKDDFPAEIDLLQDSLDKLENWLKDLHKKMPAPEFNVRRIKLPIEINAAGKAIPYTWHNSLVESFRGIKRIYYPQYKTISEKFPEHEVSFRKKLEAEGFKKMVAVEGQWDDWIHLNGSLNCLTKVMKRTHTGF